MTAYTIHAIATHFTRRGYSVQLWNDNGTKFQRRVPIHGSRGEHLGYSVVDHAMEFFGNDGRKVRAEAVQWARFYGATKDITNP